MRRLPIPMSLLDMQVNDPSYVPEPMSPLSVNAPSKRDWRASLFDRFVPQGDANLQAADKSRLFRQGLLQLAVGLQSGPNFGEALTKGLSGGLLSMNQGVDDMQNRQYKQLLAARTADPMEFRALDMQAKAAGYEPGTPGYQHFMRVRGGIESKASSAGYKFEQVPGADGKTRIQRSNPNTGEVEIYDESIGDFVPVGQSSVPSTGVPMPAPMSGAGPQVMSNELDRVTQRGDAKFYTPKVAEGTKYDLQALVASAQKQFPQSRVTSTYRSPEENARLPNAAPNSYHLDGEAWDMVPSSPQEEEAMRQWGLANGLKVEVEKSPYHVHFQPVGRGMATSNLRPRANPALVVGQSKAEQAGAEAQAKARVDLAMQPRIAAAKTAAEIDTTNSRGAQTNAVAGDKARSEAAGTAAGKREASTAQKAYDAQNQLPVLAQIKKLLPFATNGAVGNIKNRAFGYFGASTSESQTDAKLRPLAARILQTVPRFEGPQSDKDVQSYKDAAGDLANPDLPRETRLAALAELERLAKKAAGVSVETPTPANNGWGIRRK